MEAQQKKRRKTSRKSTAKKPVRRTRKQQGDIIFALDIGTRTVVGILAEKVDNGYKIIDMETAVHEKRSMTDGQIEDIEAVAQVIKNVKTALEKRRMIKLSRVCIAAAGRALRTMRNTAVCDISGKRSISAEDLKNAELDAVRETEEKFSEGQERAAFYCVGHSVIGLSLDGYKVQKPEGHRGEKLETEIIAAFLPAYVVESLCAAVDIAGLDVAGLTLEPIAAMNIVVPQELRLINIALCDIGAGTSDVATSRDGSVVAYGMATVAGDEITEDIMKKLLVDFNTAEKIKTCTDPEIEYTDILLMSHTITAEQIAELLKPSAQNLATTICEEIMRANTEAPQVVFLVGGGSKLAGLPELVAKGLGMDVSRVIMGRKELMRGVTAPANMQIGTEHATPLGIAITASEGVKYDFTTITLNGRKIRTLDTNRLTVFELTALGGIKPDKLMGRSGKALSFTIDGQRTLLRGTPMTPAEITVNGKPASLNTSVRKGDDVVIVPAKDGEDAVAYLSDYLDTELYSADIIFCGEKMTAGKYILVNDKPVTADAEIENGSVITTESCCTFGELCAREEVLPEYMLLNGAKAAAGTALNDGDEITMISEGKTELPQPQPVAAKTEAEEIHIIFNGEPAKFPVIDSSREPIFLDLLAAFSEDPTSLLAHATTTTINGRIARLGETIHDGDEIIIE
ncbi:MAG: cell division protein FtsA [Oscillospiraceae bacterium]|nr:cell division protein FtsA [Oscillospiraceae bacterium]